MVAVTTIRADPLNRLPRRTRRSFGIWRDTKAAWTLTATAWRRLPVLFAAALVMWGILRFACLRGLAEAHLEFVGRLTLPQAASLLALAIAADLGPLLLAASLWPAQHRLILKAPAPPLAVQTARAGRMLGAGLLLALSGGAVLGLFLALPFIAMPALGRISTILAMILLLPAVSLAMICLLRLSFGLPALALGLPRALAEGWDISRGHVWRTLSVWLLAYLPVGLALAGCQAARLDPIGWPETLIRPLLDVIAVSLTGSLTGLFYRHFRLPLALRPNMRPSWNRSARREPVIT
jgi:hypothetical protein